MSTSEQFASAPLVIRIEFDPRVNYAMQQNDVPVLRRLQIENTGDSPIRELRLQISAEPAFIRTWTHVVSLLGAGEMHSLEEPELLLSPEFLMASTERTRGLLHVEAFVGDQRLAHTTESLELLAWDEWGGVQSLPELLAAFVMPNHPALVPVLVDAARILGEHSGNPALDGYQSRDPKRVVAIAAALFGALQKRGLVYASAPASFESSGQRVRLPDQVLEQKLCTCLDSTCLVAAMLEQCGLRPLLVLIKGHVFVGVWLQEDGFTEAVSDDGLRLRKYAELGELLLFETTVIPGGASFSEAVRLGGKHLDALDSFECVIDVHRARQGCIRPLPVTAVRSGTIEGIDAPAALEFVLPDVTLPMSEVEVPLTAATRLDFWRRKLLDLSLRNRLLNSGDNKKTLPIACPNLPELEDRLAQDRVFRVLPLPPEFGARDPRSADAHERRTGEEARNAVLRQAMESDRLHSTLGADETQTRLTGIFRAARTALEESGASGLYLALGFLRWYETPQSERARSAPLLLLPMTLSRASMHEGFRLQHSDEEPLINVTLLEMLRQDFEVSIPGLDPLPQDEAGIDIPTVFRIVRKAIKDIPRWEVIEEARLGFFSFSKYLLWRDLQERKDALMQNALVKHLITREGVPPSVGDDFPDAAQLDDSYTPSQTYCPLDADSSQLAAVFAAAEGRNFVLEGPPGTGKSQTIANIIAHTLATGKTVLFVAEKQAALNVVHDRLKKHGLGDFCLELHSNKAEKSAVVKQLFGTLQLARAQEPSEWVTLSRRITEHRVHLNGYTRALHHRHGNGGSVFEALSRLNGLRDAPAIRLSWPETNALDIAGLEAARESVQSMLGALRETGSPARHPLRAIGFDRWSFAWQRRLEETLAEVATALRTMRDAIPALSAFSWRDQQALSWDALFTLDALAELLPKAPSPWPPSVDRTPALRAEHSVADWRVAFESHRTVRAMAARRWSLDAVPADLESLRNQLVDAQKLWFLPAWLKRRAVRQALKTSALLPLPATPALLIAEIDGLLALRIEAVRLQTSVSTVRDDIATTRSSYARDGMTLQASEHWAHRFQSLADEFCGHDPERAVGVRNHWLNAARNGLSLFTASAAMQSKLAGFRLAFSNLSRARDAISQELQLSSGPWCDDTAVAAITAMEADSQIWLANIRSLRSWCAWRGARVKALALNLGPLVLAMDNESVAIEDLPGAFEAGYWRWWAEAVIDSEPALREFSGREHARRIVSFRETDTQHRELTPQVIRARLAARVPSARDADRETQKEFDLLAHEAGKQRRHLAVRQLVQRLPKTISRLAPCMLVSPISAAQYLDTGAFDIVIFDEASQIPIWDAVGAMARGKQVIVVGDPKQLPPTSFFSRTETGDDEVEVEDLESMLDDCIAARVPWLTLDWHYRSRHESLITFSNRQYYGGRLLTFPSADTAATGVQHRQVAGVYERSGSRTNPIEARAVVDEILRRLGDPAKSNESIGVVTFSQAQQTLVENFLDSARREKPELDRFFGEDIPEKVFVKNLENVQGDERDVILFSICYGPDAEGRVAMNFGPLNRQGGERRLNVAVTRARRELVVFSSLRADQIDLSRSRARGVQDLKTFLDFAARGASALSSVNTPGGDDFESPFEAEVATALRNVGWIVRAQVGCSGYRIDLAVVDPERPGRYLLGVECDGASYHRARTARDRDRLREEVLRGLGWTLHRVWSTDWWENPDAQVRSLNERLQVLAGSKQAATDTTRGQ